MIYGYARVSTPKQLQGNSLQDQINSLKKSGCQKVFSEQYTGTKSSRPEFNKLKIVAEKGDTVMIARLDRLARNMTDMLDIIRALTKKGVKIITLKPKMRLDPNNSYGRAMIGMFATFSQLERDMIHDRMVDGKKFAIANGNLNAKGGRPSRLHNGKKDYYRAINNYAQNHTAKETSKAFACSVRTVYYVKSLFKHQK